MKLEKITRFKFEKTSGVCSTSLAHLVRRAQTRASSRSEFSQVVRKSSAKNLLTGLTSQGQDIDGVIDWDQIEACRTLEDVDNTEAITIKTVSSASTVAGTTATLRNLRRRWTPAEHGRFFEEIQAFQPPKPLTEPIPRNVCRRLLFDGPRVRDVSANAGYHFWWSWRVGTFGAMLNVRHPICLMS